MRYVKRISAGARSRVGSAVAFSIRVPLVCDVRPQRRKLQLDFCERFRANHLIIHVRRENRPPAVLQAQHLERARKGIDQPRMRHLLAGVDGELPGAVKLGGGRREDLTHPVGREREEWGIRDRRKPGAAPPSKVRNQDVLPEVDFGLIENPPASGSASTVIERRNQPGPE